MTTKAIKHRVAELRRKCSNTLLPQFGASSTHTQSVQTFYTRRVASGEYIVCTKRALDSFQWGRCSRFHWSAETGEMVFGILDEYTRLVPKRFDTRRQAERYMLSRNAYPSEG